MDLDLRANGDKETGRDDRNGVGAKARRRIKRFKERRERGGVCYPRSRGGLLPRKRLRSQRLPKGLQLLEDTICYPRSPGGLLPRKPRRFQRLPKGLQLLEDACGVAFHEDRVVV